MKLRRLGVGLVLLLSIMVAQAQMITAGQAGVSESGAATYSIPLAVSPGIGGIEPKLALSYSSQGGDGPLGVGWGVSGLSAISRCPRTLAHDGVRGSVNYDLNDRYCLDGQRLVKVAGTEGVAGSEYRTERETFAKVLANGSAGNGPASFIVKTKAGLTMEYGATADSRIEAQGKPTVRVWALNKVTDTKGNYYTVTYSEDSANGDFTINRIDYTGNAAQGQAPTNSIQFVYEARPDVTPIYHAGSLIKNSLRIKAIKSYAAASLFREYKLGYSNSRATARTILNSVQECSGTAVCLPALTADFSDIYGGYGSPISSVPSATGYLAPYWKLAMVDVNGDGKTDVLGLYISDLNSGDGIRTAVMLSNGDGTYGAPISSVPSATGYLAPYWKLTLGDVNGDGKTDIIAIYSSDKNGGDGIRTAVMLSNGDGTYGAPISSVPSATGYLAPYWQLGTADVNGDGKTDIIGLYTYDKNGGDGIRTVVMLSNGDGTFGAPISSVPSATGYLAPYWKLTMGDVNGDGKTDIIGLYTFNQNGGDGIKTAVMLSNGDGTYGAPISSVPSATGYLAPYWQLSTADVNGDGKTDIIGLYTFNQNGGDGIRTAVMLSKGDGTYGAPISSVPSATGYLAPHWKLTMGDVNGDGKTDIIGLYTFDQNAGDGIKTAVILSKGDGTYGAPVSSVPSATGYLAPYWQLGTADVNGDGKTDVIGLYTYDKNGGDGIRVASVLSSGGPVDVVSGVRNALGGTTNFNYKPLTDSAVYTKGSGSVYPLMDIQGPLYVVSSLVVPNGVGGSLTTSYRYGGLKAEVGTGRGLLGFRWVETKQVETGLTSTTTYRQDWPYVGQPSQVKKTLAGAGNGGLLGQSDISYGCMDYVSASGCTVAVGRRYFPYVSQNIDQGWDLNGAALPTVTTTNTFDSYGNATQITVSTGDGYSKTTNNVYQNDTTNWYLGRLQRATVTSVTP